MTTWVSDPAHSSIDFSVRHLMISKVRGQFTSFEGKIEGDIEQLEQASVQFSIDVQSIDTNQQQRDNHLRSADFFDVAQHPTITFNSSTISKNNDGTFNITGNMTIKGVTAQTTFQTEVAGVADLPDGRVAGLHVTNTINRQEYGLTWQQALETGGVVVGDTIHISADFEFQQQS